VILASVPPRITLAATPEDDDEGEGDSPSKGEIVDPAANTEKPKGGWKGNKANRYRGGKPFAKPKPILLDYRIVYRGNLTDEQKAKPSIQSILELKMEDNARFLSEYAKLEKDQEERIARKRMEVHKGIEQLAAAVPAVSKDQQTEDTLLMLDELLAEAVAASKS